MSNPNDMIYYANGGTSNANGGANYWPEGVKVRHGPSATRVVLALALAAVVPIVILVFTFKLL
jgi:hypothetical protein